VNIVKAPGPMRLLCGGALAYWLSHIINSAFVGIAVMIVLFVPVFLHDYFSEQIDSHDRLINQSKQHSSELLKKAQGNADNKEDKSGMHGIRKIK
jgi:hypothetical protein